MSVLFGVVSVVVFVAVFMQFAADTYRFFKEVFSE